MQIDHIDENTMRVRIEKNELAKRGLKVLDLLGDKDRIQQFFYSILDEIDTDNSFSGDSPVTFQVMPSNGGLDLLITRVTEQNRNNFSKLFDHDFNENDNGKHKPLTNLQFGDLDNDGEFADDYDDDEEDDLDSLPIDREIMKSPLANLADDCALKNERRSKRPDKKKLAFSFTDLDYVTELADCLANVKIESVLYYSRDQFYLDLTFPEEPTTELKPSDIWAIANEYGNKVRLREIARIRMAGKCLIEHDALETLRHYFSKK